jgi:hypothetical protein
MVEIRKENQSRLLRKESKKFKLKQELLEMMRIPDSFSQFSLFPQENLSNSSENPEVSLSSEGNQADPHLNLLQFDSQAEDIDISQEIQVNDVKNIPIMQNKFFPVSEMFKRNRHRIIRIVEESHDFGPQARKIIGSSALNSFALVFSPVNQKKVGIFALQGENAVKIVGDGLPDCIPLSKIMRKFLFDFVEGDFVETSQLIDGFDFSEELLS